MTTETTDTRVLHGAGIVSNRPFVPATEWPELEEARVRHERALAEMRDARREEALVTGRHRAQQAQELKAAAGRVLDGSAAVDPAMSEDARRRELDAISLRLKAARLALHDAVLAALQVVEEHPEWSEEIVARRAAAEAERAELLAQAEAAKVRAHSEDHMAQWLHQAATKAAPQPYREAGPPPPPPQTVAEAFGRRGAA